MSSTELRQSCLEKLTLGVIKSLSSRIGIRDVELDQKNAANPKSISSWESTHCCTLPTDLKDFYLTSGGFLLTWKVKLKDELLPIGRMEINPISKVERLQMFHSGNQTAYSLADIDMSEEEDPYGDVPHLDQRSRIFELDPCQNTGKVCLVYRNTKQGIPAKDADFWFLDKSLRWHYITDTFSSYFRIMLMKLGLPQWHYLFTDIGPCPTVLQWYNLYAPTSLDQMIGESLTSNDDTHINTIDVARIFKGKEKKKPANPANNAAAPANRRKMGSPTPNRLTGPRGAASALLKSTAPTFR